MPILKNCSWNIRMQSPSLEKKSFGFSWKVQIECRSGSSYRYFLPSPISDRIVGALKRISHIQSPPRQMDSLQP